MSDRKTWNRREFLRAAGAAGVAGFPGIRALADTPPETTTIRLTLSVPGSICSAPVYLAPDLLRAEGFSQVEDVKDNPDIDLYPVPPLIPALDAQRPLVVLAGVHGGCYELFASERVKTLRDLKGGRIATVGQGRHPFTSSMLAYVGIDPRQDVTWVDGVTDDGAMRLFVDGKTDAFLAYPPQPQNLRAQRIGHVIVDTGRDRPWSQYFCCMVVVRREFLRDHPVATKRALRAILKATDICAREPERAASDLVNKNYESNYGLTVEALKGLSYSAWRTFDPESTLRFYALRFREVGMIKSTPQKLLAQSTDWRFLNELKRELKA